VFTCCWALCADLSRLAASQVGRPRALGTRRDPRSTGGYPMNGHHHAVAPSRPDGAQSTCPSSSSTRFGSGSSARRESVSMALPTGTRTASSTRDHGRPGQVVPESIKGPQSRAEDGRVHLWAALTGMPTRRSMTRTSERPEEQADRRIWRRTRHGPSYVRRPRGTGWFAVVPVLDIDARRRSFVTLRRRSSTCDNDSGRDRNDHGAPPNVQKAGCPVHRAVN